MNKPSLMDRLRYRFDETLSRGPIALIGYLGLVSAIIIVVVSAFVAIVGIAPEGEGPLGFADAAWRSLMRTLDAGTMGGDAGWGFRLAMFVVTLGGMFVVSMLIGVLTAGIEGKVEDLRKGHSVVLEQGHTVILGWSPQIFTIVSELIEANANQKRACIAILADKDKMEMEDELAARIPKRGPTRIVCRTGSPIDPADLAIVNPQAARAIIILAPESADPDAAVIKTILALTNRREHTKPYHIVAEMGDARNVEVARMIGHDEVEVVLTGDLISRVTVQTARQSGLSVVHTELLDFGGDEIYFKEEPALAGKTFAEALFAYEDSALIGLYRAGGRVQVNPPMDTVIQAGDQVIAISEDDDTIRLSGKADLAIDLSAVRSVPPRVPQPERSLILGWNRRAPSIIRDLDNYVAPGSEILVVASEQRAPAGLGECADLKNQRLTLQHAETTDRRTLDELHVAGFDHVIVLAYELEPQEADAQTLITLLHLRDIADHASSRVTIVSEMLDVRNRELAKVTRADDFIVSDKLVSLMMAQLSENKRLAPVFQDLFDPEGSEIYLKPAADYVEPGKPVNFYTVVEAARRRSEVAIGYRLNAQRDDAAHSYGVCVNPDKSYMITFGERDKVIVLAED